MFGSEIFASAPGTRHDLVIDQKNAVLITDFANAGIVAVGRDQRAGRSSANRFHDETKNGFRALFEYFGL